MLKRTKALENPEVERKQFFCLQWTPFNTFLQVGFTGLYGSWNIANSISHRRIKVGNLDLVLFHADTYWYNTWELADLKLLTKRNVVLKLQMLRRLYKVMSCDHHLPFQMEKCSQITEAQLQLLFGPILEDNSLPSISRDGTEKITLQLLPNTISIDRSPRSSIQYSYKHGQAKHAFSIPTEQQDPIISQFIY